MVALFSLEVHWNLFKNFNYIEVIGSVSLMISFPVSRGAILPDNSEKRLFVFGSYYSRGRSLGYNLPNLVWLCCIFHTIAWATHKLIAAAPSA